VQISRARLSIGFIFITFRSIITAGLCRSVGREMFHQNVSVEVMSQSEVKMRGDTNMQHTMFKVMFDDMPSSDHQLGISLEKKRSSRTQTSELKYCLPDEPLISAEKFCEIFPFHMVFDKNLVIKQCGITILRWTDVPSAENLNLTDIFTLSKPEMPLTYDNIKRFRNSNYILENRANTGAVLLTLRGKNIPKINDKNMIMINNVNYFNSTSFSI
jgi:guanylate cyclase soluble subunit beta